MKRCLCRHPGPGSSDRFRISRHREGESKYDLHLNQNATAPTKGKRLLKIPATIIEKAGTVSLGGCLYHSEKAAPVTFEFLTWGYIYKIYC